MFYIFHGDDSHSQLEALAKFQTKMGDPSLLDLNTTRLEGHVTFNDIQQAASSIPFLAKERLVIVRDFFRGKPDKKVIKQLAKYLPDLPETTRLFFLESKKLSAKHAILKLAEAEELGYVKKFPLPQGGALDRWIREAVAQRNGRISGQAVHMLAANVGSNLEILENEIEKLTLYAGEEEITAQDAARLSPYAAEANIFDLVDALGNRNNKKASLLLHQKLSEGGVPFSVFGMIIRQFRLLIQVKELAQDGKRPSTISQELKLHSYVTGKLYQQSQGFSLSQLEQIYRHLLDIDIGAKTGRHELPTALNLLVASLTLP